MKKQGHPSYQDVLFIDSSNGHKFLCGSTYQTDERETFEGQEYPVCRVSVSSASHPFYTGSQSVLDTEGRVDRFKKKYAAAASRSTAQKEPEPKKAAPKGKPKTK